MSDELTFDNVIEDIFESIATSENAIFRPSVGDDVDCTVDLRQEIDEQPYASEGQAWAKRLTIEYRLEEVGQRANRGDTFIIDSVEYKVKAIIEGDSRVIKVTVTT
jgi:hypothetical protein